MSRRIRVLLSAFACEPHKGSEPEVGWQWAWQMARFHDVTVLTQSKNRPAIEEALKAWPGPQPKPRFVYFDLPEWAQKLRTFPIGLRVYYVFWQKWARAAVQKLHQENPFDLLHHVTFAAFRYPTVIWGPGAPCIWGPIGGIESVPVRLLPWGHPISLLQEGLRNILNVLQTAPYRDLSRRALSSDKVLVSTIEMQEALTKLDIESQLMPTIGLKTGELTYRAHRISEGPLKILFVGKIITLKGVDLALKALKESGTDATLTLIGTGNYLRAANRLAKQLGLGERVTFAGQVTRQEVLTAYGEYDVLLFPSLHDTGGYAVIEAMFNELPVICLDCGGPPVAVKNGCGIKVPVSSPKAVVAGLADAIRFYHGDRQALLSHGKAARETILENYDWNRKGEQMRAVYEETLAGAAQGKAPPKKVRVPASRRHLFSLKGSVVASTVLLLIGLIGFLSLSHLKNKANAIVNDTLPGLSYSGAANAYIADSARTLWYITVKDAGERAKLRAEIELVSARTTKYLLLYKSTIYENEDKTNFENMIELRGKYTHVRDHILDLADAGKEQEALAAYNNLLTPVHDQVKKAADRLFYYNMHQGEIRGKEIMGFCTETQIVIASAGVLIFVIGFLIGVFK